MQVRETPFYISDPVWPGKLTPIPAIRLLLDPFLQHPSVKTITRSPSTGVSVLLLALQVDDRLDLLCCCANTEVLTLERSLWFLRFLDTFAFEPINPGADCEDDSRSHDSASLRVENFLYLSCEGTPDSLYPFTCSSAPPGPDHVVNTPDLRPCLTA